MISGNLNLTDIIVIAVYFAVVLWIAWWASKRRKKKSEDYFLAGRDVGWLAVGTSLFASNIGSEHLVGLAGTGAASGLAVGHFEWLASIILLILGWVFVSFYLSSGVYTMPEFLEKRYNSASRWYFTTISVIAYVLTKISVALYAGGVIIEAVVGLKFWYGAVAIILITGLYTIVGGLGAVIYTELVQTFVLIAGSLLLVFLGLNEVGGWSALEARAPEGFFSVWKPMDHPEFPWTGIIFGAPILGIWYWCTDQYIVQRVLSARGESEANTGSILAGYLKILPPFLFVVPGIIAAVLYEGIAGKTSDSALPMLATELLPVGLRGFLVAALLAALMSSLSSVFNSCSTLITFDFFKKIRPNASEKTLVTVGRIATGAVVVIGLLWIPFMKYISSQLYIYLQSVQGYIAPPIAACFLLGIFLSRLNGIGAFVSLISGFVIGSTRLILELVNGTDKNGLPSGTVWEWVAEINFLHFAIFLFIICTALLIVVSLLTAPPDKNKICGLTWGTIEKRGKAAEEEEKLPEPGIPLWRKRLNVLLSILLIFIIAFLWIIFA
ncbi:MAG TPA: sodium:solute symporter [Thermodesulfobacteriota bacterium]|nr:sodium:solute symporter [Thermodesulfobacteriota bacterium]